MPTSAQHFLCMSASERALERAIENARERSGILPYCHVASLLFSKQNIEGAAPAVLKTTAVLRVWK